MAEPTLYLFDGYNLLHAGSFDDPRELRDLLAGFVALKGARGVLVFDGAGTDVRLGQLEVRYVKDADSLLERLAAENRARERVLLVSSDFAVRGTSGQEVATISSQRFLVELGPAIQAEPARSPLGDLVDDDTRARLERLRRGEGRVEEPPVETFRRLEERWAEVVATRDVDAARELLAEDFSLSSDAGVAPRMTRDAWLEALPAIATESLTASVGEARVFGNLAVVSATLRWDARMGERDLSGEYAVVDVFTRRAGRWQASWRLSRRL